MRGGEFNWMGWTLLILAMLPSAAFIAAIINWILGPIQ
jgi:hypothetical protein